MKRIALFLLVFLWAASARAADNPISAFSTNSAPASGDLLLSVDISDTSQSAQGTNKKLLLSALGTFYEGSLSLQNFQGAVTDAQVPDNITITGISGANVSFADTDNNWTATNVQAALEELDDVINSGVPNSANAKVDWSQLANVPAGFADNSDDGSGGGAGDVTAAAAFANDNRLIRSDGTGKGVQASGITVDDSNNISGIGTSTATSYSGALNGSVGATTPSTGVFTTLVAGNTTSLLLGTTGSAVGNIGFRNATSGTVTLAPPTGALGTYQVTLPNAASVLPILSQQVTWGGLTAARTITLIDANFTAARQDAAQTFIGTQTLTGSLGSSSVATSPAAGDDDTSVATSAFVNTQTRGSNTGTHSSPSTTNPLTLSFTAIMHSVWYGVTGEIDLPAASGYAGRGFVVYNTGAFTVTLDPNGSEVIVRDGTVQSAGISMTLSSGAGNYVALLSDGVRWITLGFKGTLAAGS